MRTVRVLRPNCHIVPVLPITCRCGVVSHTVFVLRRPGGGAAQHGPPGSFFLPTSTMATNISGCGDALLPRARSHALYEAGRENVHKNGWTEEVLRARRLLINQAGKLRLHLIRHQLHVCLFFGSPRRKLPCTLWPLRRHAPFLGASVRPSPKTAPKFRSVVKASLATLRRLLMASE